MILKIKILFVAFGKSQTFPKSHLIIQNFSLFAKIKKNDFGIFWKKFLRKNWGEYFEKSWKKRKIHTIKMFI